MQVNIKWHLKHPMPKHASFEQRVEWHLAHKKNCACRDIPGKIKAEVIKRKIKL